MTAFASQLAISGVRIYLLRDLSTAGKPTAVPLLCRLRTVFVVQRTYMHHRISHNALFPADSLDNTESTRCRQAVVHDERLLVGTALAVSNSVIFFIFALCRPHHHCFRIAFEQN